MLAHEEKDKKQSEESGWNGRKNLEKGVSRTAGEAGQCWWILAKSALTENQCSQSWGNSRTFDVGEYQLEQEQRQMKRRRADTYRSSCE